MDWKLPVLVFVYGYGACFVCLLVIMTSIIITRKLVEGMQDRAKNAPKPNSKS